MRAVNLNISLDEKIAEALRRRAAELGKSVSRYLTDLIEEDARRAQDALAAEGYRALSADTAAFADAAWPVGVQPWPAWDEEPHP